MKRIHYNNIKSALDSLTSATSREIVLAGEKISFEGLNSEYVSHQNIEVAYGHGISGLVIIKNHRVWLGITRAGTPEIAGDVASVPLPAYHLRDLFLFPASKPLWLSGIVTIHIPDLFNGFDGTGNPIFKHQGKIVAVYNNDYGDKNKDTIWEYKDPDYIGRVGCADIMWNGTALTLGKYGSYEVGDLVSRECAIAYNQLDEQTVDDLDLLLEKIGLHLTCAMSDTECEKHPEGCKSCEHNLKMKIEKM